jgi:hypothetical protein
MLQPDSAEDRKCPKCGRDGEIVGHREYRLGGSEESKNWVNEYFCPSCGCERKREGKSK